jgi:hypothetical protein
LRDNFRVRLAIALQHGLAVAIGDWGFHGFVEVGAISVQAFPKELLETISLCPKDFLILPTEPSDASSNGGFLFDAE